MKDFIRFVFLAGKFTSGLCFMCCVYIKEDFFIRRINERFFYTILSWYCDIASEFLMKVDFVFRPVIDFNRILC